MKSQIDQLLQEQDIQQNNIRKLRQSNNLLNQNLNNDNNSNTNTNNFNTNNFDVNNFLSNCNSNRIIKRDEINEIYEFTFKYDGSPGEAALEYRNAVINHNNFVRTNLPNDYSEVRVVMRVLKNLTDNAALQYNKRTGPRFSRLHQFLNWFDNTFKLQTLRQDIYNQLVNWSIDPSTPDLAIVTKFRQKVNLFNQTTDVSTQDVIKATPLTDAIQVSALNRAIQRHNVDLFDFIDNYMKDFDRAAAPINIDILDDVIDRGIKYLQTKRLNSNKMVSDPTNLGSVNAISRSEFPYFTNSNYNINRNSNLNYNSNYIGNNYSSSNSNNSNNQFGFNVNNNNNYNSNINDFNNRSRGRGRGYSNRSRGRGSRGRGSNRGYRGRNRGRGRGRRYRGRGRGRGYNRPTQNCGYCSVCGDWGHLGKQCSWIHMRQNSHLIAEYAKTLPAGFPKKLPQDVNVTQQDNSDIKSDDTTNKKDSLIKNFYKDS